MLDKKSLFNFVDVHGNESTLTLDKHCAEAVQRLFGDVHKWIQEQYNELIRDNGESSRRAIGDMIRKRASAIFLNGVSDEDL